MAFGKDYWNKIANKMLKKHHYLDKIIGLQKREVHLALFKAWTSNHSGKNTLKTDLFEEAFGNDSILDNILDDQKEYIGMDISTQIVQESMERMKSSSNRKIHHVACDVRSLPFVKDSLDSIFSTSTLDHFNTHEEIQTSLKEFSRCLRVNGMLILTLDNGQNIFYPLLRLIGSTGLGPYHIGPTLTMKSMVSSLSNKGFNVLDTSILIHNPRVITTILANLIRVIFAKRADKIIQRLIDTFDRMGNWRTKHYTGCFIAAKAIKKDYGNL